MHVDICALVLQFPGYSNLSGDYIIALDRLIARLTILFFFNYDEAHFLWARSDHTRSSLDSLVMAAPMPFPSYQHVTRNVPRCGSARPSHISSPSATLFFVPGELPKFAPCGLRFVSSLLHHFASQNVLAFCSSLDPATRRSTVLLQYPRPFCIHVDACTCRRCVEKLFVLILFVSAHSVKPAGEAGVRIWQHKLQNPHDGPLCTHWAHASSIFPPEFCS